MNGLINGIIAHRKLIIALFITVAAVCAILQMGVKVNYTMTDYLPPDAQSTEAYNIMNREFTETIPNTRVMVKNVSIREAMDYKQRLAEADGVLEVMWLDDVMDITQPLEMGDKDTIEGFYKDGNALFSVTIAKGMEKTATAALQNLVGPDNAVAGEAPDLATVQGGVVSETTKAFIILMPIVIIILILSTTSFIEPLLFLLAIGLSVVINMGTNLIFGDISFMTNSVSPILQLACSLDYAIFLLNSFAANRKKYAKVEEAMKQAIKESMSTVAASAATTLFGFISLVFMNFRIGADLGIILAKGIMFSFITVMIFLPAFTLTIYKLIDKTRHRDLMPSFRGAYRGVSKIAAPALIIVALVIVPAFLGQSHTEFTYGNGSVAPTGRVGLDSAAIKEEFGQSTIMVLLAPRGDVAKEQALVSELKRLDYVTSVVSYTDTVGAVIPPEYLDEEVTEQFYSKDYARIIVYTDTPEEGDEAFAAVETIQSIMEEQYGDEARSVGQSANLHDMKELVDVDNIRVNLIAIALIFLVLLLTFRSGVLPFLLLLTIETGIWINLSIPYFAGTPINFVGYLVLSTVQLGATVDYAILLTNTYIKYRRMLPQKEAIKQALGESFRSIVVSASILSIAGFTLFATSTNPVISGLGLLLGRGTLFSFGMVVCFLPAMLTLLDKPIGKLTYKAGFLFPKGGKT
ncbi:MAG: MMPL family transporter [Clostridiales Family XIII bacterium]|jgi:predicted RND superfamily exporter protein|nr:MMPL family transporter [Clostridiales Family XIII bacterium]